MRTQCFLDTFDTLGMILLFFRLFGGRSVPLVALIGGASAEGNAYTLKGGESTLLKLIPNLVTHIVVSCLLSILQFLDS
jgi:hypothetical protein